MTRCRFADLTFDTQRLELHRRGVALPMRPKTAALLRVLIAERGQIVGKRVIFQRVWKTEHVQDQSLFQAISEIRRTLAPLNPILTHPNLGYEWVLPANMVSPPGRHRWSVAAAATLTLAMAATLATLSTQWPASAPVTRATPTVTTGSAKPADTAIPQGIAQFEATPLPAMQAYALGIQSLQLQRPADAEMYFNIAAHENPAFHEASLMVAETLLQQGRYEEAVARAEQVLRTAADDPYAKVAAMDTLSKISQHSGSWQSALRWAENAAADARTYEFACAVEDTAGRLAELLEKAGQNSERLFTGALVTADDNASHSPGGNIPGGDTASAATFDNGRTRVEAPAYCTRLHEPLPAEPGADVSRCDPADSIQFAARPTASLRRSMV